MPEEPFSGPTSGRPTGGSLRRSILETARDLLIADGYNNLSMRKIARATGCSATSIYLHFESKDALIHSLIEQGMENLAAQLGAAVEPESPPLTRLRRLCLAYVAFGLQNPEYYEAMFTLHPERMARYPPEKYRRARRNLKLFAEALADAQAAGEAEVEDADLAASVLWAALHGAVSLLIARRLDTRIDEERFIEQVVQRAISGFRTPEASTAST